jgi:hypothetical protein
VATAEKYEEILAVLDDLSYRDFQVLLILQRFETETPLEEQPCADPGVAKLYRATKFWEDFSDEVASETGIPSAGASRIVGNVVFSLACENPSLFVL